MRDRQGVTLIDEEVRTAILAPLDASVGIDGREDEGDAGELLRELRSQRKALVQHERAEAEDKAGTLEEGLAWDTVAEQATDYLVRYGKDLEVAAFLIEAAVRQEGPAGLAETMKLLADLVETFWDQGLYPAEDEDGIETRFYPLTNLSGGGSDNDGVLIQPVRRMTLVEVSGTALSYLDKVRADALLTSAQSGTPEQKAAKAEQAADHYARIDALAARGSRASFEAVIEHVAATEGDWRRAVAFITERTKPRMPAASKLSAELQAAREWLRILVARLPEEAAPPAVDVGVAEQLEAGGMQQPAAAASTSNIASIGRISLREDALRAVVLAADYFADHEPLSPIGATLREVDRRARMSLHDLLSELIPDESARDLFYWRSGIRPPAPLVEE